MRSQWLVSLFAVGIVVVGLGVGAWIFRQKSHARDIDRKISFIESLEAEKRYPEAIEQINGLMPQVRSSETRRRLDRMAMAYLMRTDNPANIEKCRQRAEKYLADYPKDPHLGTIYYCLGKIALEKEKNRDKARADFQKVVSSYPKDPYYQSAVLGLVSVDVGAAEGIDSDHMLGAQKRLEELLAATPKPEVRDAAEDLLSEINRGMFFSPNLQPGEQQHVILKGDSLDRLSKKYKVSADLIMRVNKIANPRNLRINHRIRIPNINLSIKVDVGDNTLVLYNNGKFFIKYPVRTGATAEKTPKGKFVVRERVINPQWTDPNGKTFKGGDPANELGTRWMGFDYPGVGIHGTIHEETIGTYASNGCIGMRRTDVEELYDLVRIGTPVEVVGERKKNAPTYAPIATGTKITGSSAETTSGTKKR
jgi:lipoprotein-anchoring transpeptidase ErfK/SrfK